MVKFIYSEKATNFLRNLHLFLTGTSASQKKMEILQFENFLSSSFAVMLDEFGDENYNFNSK